MPHGWNTYPIKSFFDPETKFGFEITEQQKKVWAIELEMAGSPADGVQGK